MSGHKCRVMLVIPSVLVSRGVRSLLSEYPEFEVVCSLSDMADCRSRVAALAPDLVIIDPCVVEYGRRTSVRAALSECMIVALASTVPDDDSARQYAAVIGVNDGQVHIINKLRRVVSSGRSVSDPQDGNDELSQREREILVAVASGKTNKEIASLHNISVHTVISHRKNITRKTGIKTVSGLTVYALLNNLINQTDV